MFFNEAAKTATQNVDAKKALHFGDLKDLLNVVLRYSRWFLFWSFSRNKDLLGHKGWWGM